MRSYDTTRGILGFMEFASWAGICIGVVTALAAGSAAAKFSGYGAPSFFAVALPGIVIALFGLIGVVQCQLARAGVDTAELTGQVLKVSRDQLEVSRQALRQGQVIEEGFAALRQAPLAETESHGKVGFETMGISPSGIGPSADLEKTDAKPTFSVPEKLAFDSKGVPKHEVRYLSDDRTIMEYRDAKLEFRGESHIYNGIAFPSLDRAKTYIDKLRDPV